MSKPKPYPPDLPASARRHLEAAEDLYHPNKRRDVAGYLYGIAAECALKAIMREAGLQPLSEEQRREDPFYAHFPHLKTLLRDTLEGRLSQPLKRYSEDAVFMTQWDTAMRYSKGSAIAPKWVDRWREHAQQIVDAIGTT